VGPVRDWPDDVQIAPSWLHRAPRADDTRWCASVSRADLPRGTLSHCAIWSQ